MNWFAGTIATATLLLPGLPIQAAELLGPSSFTRIETEYLATLHAPLHAPQAANQNLLIFHPRDGGSLSGRINGKVLSPGGDWVRIMPDGTMRIDVRMSVQLDDGSLLYMTYGGVLRKPDPQSWARFQRGEKIEAPLWYYVITPNFETTSNEVRLAQWSASGRQVRVDPVGPRRECALRHLLRAMSWRSEH